MATAELTPKQVRFVEEFMVDLNATQAAIRAGYSQRNADKIGPELLGKTRVARAIQEVRQKQSERTQVTADVVREGLLREAQGRGADTTPTARVAAWAHLAKHLGMFKENVNVTMNQDEAYKELLALAKERHAILEAQNNGHAS